MWFLPSFSYSLYPLVNSKPNFICRTCRYVGTLTVPNRGSAVGGNESEAPIQVFLVLWLCIPTYC